jgi:hypothetical protein
MVKGDKESKSRKILLQIPFVAFQTHANIQLSSIILIIMREKGCNDLPKLRVEWEVGWVREMIRVVFARN